MSSSADMFCFPAGGGGNQYDNEISDHQFEFLPVTAPGSPKSPADHLFFNGKLLPHVFPVAAGISYSRSTSRTSSRDSLMSSRSNSTNSRSSGGSIATARNSGGGGGSCDQGNYVYNNTEKQRAKAAARGNRPTGSSSSSSHSQKWQFIAAAPVLKHQGSSSRKLQQVDHQDQVFTSQRSIKSKNSTGKSWFGRRVFNSLSSACKECHGIKASQMDEEEEDPES